MTGLEKAVRYGIQVVSATALPMLVAAALVIICAFITDLVGLGITGSAYQRVATSPPFVVQSLVALLLGYALGGGRSRPYALWVWVWPALWMSFAIVVWHPAADSTQSVWKYFFSGEWRDLPPSATRSMWVIAQFTHTVPLYSSLAYFAGALARRSSTSKTLEAAS